jgi:hypothetical protein
MVKRLLPRTKDGLFGVRIGDVAAVKEDPKHINIWDYIRQRFEEDVRSGKLDVERFAAGVYIYCLKKYSRADAGRDYSKVDTTTRYESRVSNDMRRFGARWLAAAKVIAESDSVGDCELKQRMTWWDNLAYKASTANRTTRDWVELVCACSYAIDNNYYNQAQAGPLGTLTRMRFDGGPFVRWSLLRTSEIGNVVYDVSNPGTKVSARRFTPGEAVIAAHDSVIRLDRDLAYMLENHPITCVLFGLGRHSNHWSPSDLTEVVKCDKINKVDCLMEATISNEEYLKFVGDTDRRTQKQKKQTQKGAGIC